MIALILAGGSGSRLWPLSRELYPKQFLDLGYDDSLLRLTARRIQKFTTPDRIFAVTNHQHKDSIISQLQTISSEITENIIVEPMGRNTAPAIALSMNRILKNFSADEIVAVMPSDHVIEDEENFVRCVRLAENVAKTGLTVTFGAKPDRPETGYGYIQAGELISGFDAEVFKVKRFTEKPDFQTASSFLKSGDYCWNAGMLFFRISDFIKELNHHTPEIWSRISEINTEDPAAVTDAYNGLPSISIDYALMEKTDKTALIPVNFSWSDVGDFEAMYRLNRKKDQNGNVLCGKVVQQDCSGSLFVSSGRLLAAANLKDMLVIDSADATLICPRKDSQEVKKIYQELKGRGEAEISIHTTVYRPWGYYTTLEKGQGFIVKRIVVYPGKRLSLQRHYHRSEHWTVVSGTARIIRGNEEIHLSQNESTFIPATTGHRLENPGRIDLQLIEVQVGQLLIEEDIERIEDDYGRSGN